MTVTACPACDGTHIHSRSHSEVGRHNLTDDTGDRWKCSDCDATFDEPTQREPRDSGASNKLCGLPKRLAAMDPDTDLRGEGA